MIIQTRQIAFAGASFGARSYTTPQTDCWVSNFENRPDGWEAYCDCMFSAGDPNRAKCRKHPCANPFDPNPDCIGPSLDPRWLSPPWTEIGAGIRGIPKDGGGLLYLFSSAFAPVEPWELEPDNYLEIADRDPLRAAIIIAESGKVLASPAGATYPYAKGRQLDGRNSIQLHYALAGNFLTQIPIVGGVLTAVKAAELFLPLGPLNAWMTKAAREYAFVKDPSGGIYASRVEPILKRRGWEIFKIAGGLGSLLGADPAPLIAYLCERAGRMLPTGPSVAQDVRIARAMLFAAAKIAPKIAELIKDPETALRSSTTYEDFGNAIAGVAKELKPTLDPNTYAAVLAVGDFFRYFAPSITVAASATINGDWSRLCCGEDTAFDLIPVNVPGLRFKISTMVGIAQDVASAGQTTAAQVQSLILNGDNAKSGLQTISQLFNAITVFARELQKALNAFGPVAQFFSTAVEKLLEQKTQFDTFVTNAQQQNASGKTPANAVLISAKANRLLGDRAALRPDWVRPLLPGVINLPGLNIIGGGSGTGGSSTPPPTNTPPPGTPSGGGVAPVIAGAGAGFLVGGPVGALVGGAALALLSRKK